MFLRCTARVDGLGTGCHICSATPPEQRRPDEVARAHIIAADVYDRGAPVPTVSASPDQNRFLRDVAAIISEVAQEQDIVLE